MRRAWPETRVRPETSPRSMRAWLVATLALALACSDAPPAGPPELPAATLVSDPAAVEFVTSDVEHFWEAYDAGASRLDFDRLYLARATPGLAHFLQVRSVTAPDLASMVVRAPRYFAAIRDRSRGIATSGAIDASRAAFARMKQLHPPAAFPPVTLLVGRFATAGTISAGGIAIGAEFFGADATTPVDELGAFQRHNVHSFEQLPVIVTHELVHVLQALAGRPPTSQMDLLAQSLMEGGADFVGELASGGNVNAWMFPYALQNEAALWAEFQADMQGTDVSRWLYNQGAATGDRPGDLGYFFGYRIAEAYYRRAADPGAAIATLIALEDPDGILAAGGYAPGLPASAY